MQKGRSLPVFFLNGRAGADSREESANLGPKGSLKRRLNLIDHLVEDKPRMLVVLSADTTAVLEEVASLWDEEDFRAELCVVGQGQHTLDYIDGWLTAPAHPTMVDVCQIGIEQFVAGVTRHVESLVREDRIVLHLRTPGGGFNDIDVSGCELTEFPVLDRYSLIQQRDIPELLAEELSNDDVTAFFERSSYSWKPYAAGLPWRRFEGCEKKLLNALRQIEARGPAHNELMLIVSEPGAGGKQGTYIVSNSRYTMAKRYRGISRSPTISG